MSEMPKLSSKEDRKMTAEFKKYGLLTGKEMIMKRALSGQRDFPSLGSREYRPTNSWLEKKQIENCLEERLSLVKSARIEKLSDLSVAEWIPDVNKAKVVKKVGKHWDVFGHHKDDSDWLYPEETLFLIEMNILQLFYAEIPVSIEQAYLILINEDCSLNEYRVFSYLSKRGYKVVRHFRDTTFVDQNKKSVEKSNNDVKSSTDCISRLDQSKNPTENLTNDSDVPDCSSRLDQCKTTAENVINDSDVQSLNADCSFRLDQKTTAENLTNDADVPSLTADCSSRPDQKTTAEKLTEDSDVQSKTADSSSRPDQKTTAENLTNDAVVRSLTADCSSRLDQKTTAEKLTNDAVVRSLTADCSSRLDQKTTAENLTNDADVPSLTADCSSRLDQKTTAENLTNDADVPSLTADCSSRLDQKTTAEKLTEDSDVQSKTADSSSRPEQSKITPEESKNNRQSMTADSSPSQCEKMAINGSDSADGPSSPDVTIIENTIDIIDLDEIADEAEPGDSRIAFLNKEGSRFWYPRLNSVFSNTRNERNVFKTFKKSDYFDLGFKTRMTILRTIDRNPHSTTIKPPDERFIPKGIKIKYGMYMIDVKKMKGDVPSTSRNSPKPRHFQHRFNERRFTHHSATPINPWAHNQTYAQPLNLATPINPRAHNQSYAQPLNHATPINRRAHNQSYAQPLNHATPINPRVYNPSREQALNNPVNNFNHPLMAVINMMASAMNMLQPRTNLQTFNPRPFRPQMNQNFYNPTYNHHYRQHSSLRNQNQRYQRAERNKINLKRSMKKYTQNRPSGLKIITDYIELDDSDEEPPSKMFKIDSKIETIDLSEVDEKKWDKKEIIQLSDNSESSNDIPVVKNASNDNNATVKSSNEKSEPLNKTEKSSNEHLNEAKKASDELPNWENLKKVPLAVFKPILDCDKVYSKESAYHSLEIIKPMKTNTKSSTKLKISFDAYNPTDHLKKSARSLPKLRIIVSSETEDFPTNDDLDSLRNIFDDGVPFLFGVALEESIGFYLYDKVSINKFV